MTLLMSALRRWCDAARRNWPSLAFTRALPQPLAIPVRRGT